MLDLMFSGIINAMHRAAYRMAYPVWRFCLRQFSIRTQGAQVAVWNNEQILLVRNSYRDTYVFPGGFMQFVDWIDSRIRQLVARRAI